MNIRDIASKVGGYLKSKRDDDKGFIQQGRLTAKPITNFAKNQVQSTKQIFGDYLVEPLKQMPVFQGLSKSPVIQFGKTLGSTAVAPFMSKTLDTVQSQNTQNVNKALQMAQKAKTPEERKRWLSLAQSSSGGTENFLKSYQDQYNKSGLQIAGEGLGTAATIIGGPKLTPKSAITTGLIGGGLNKVMGGSFGEGFGTSLGYAPAFQGVASLTNPLLSKVVNFTPVKGELTKRGVAGLSNVAQGIVQDVSTGQKTNAASMGIDFAIGVGGGKSQFDAFNPNSKIKVKGAVSKDVYMSDKMTLNEAKQRFKLGIRVGEFEKLGKDIKNMFKNYGLESYPNWDKLTLRQQVDILDDRLSEMARQGDNITMGIVDKSKGVIPEVGGKGLTVYRGGTGEGKYLSTSKTIAEDFAKNRGGTVSEYTLKPNAKVINYDDIPTAGYKGINDYNMEQYGSGKDLLSFQNGKLEADYTKAENWAKQNGYDAVKFPTEGEIRVINNKALSQSPSIPEVGGKGLIDEAKIQKIYDMSKKMDDNTIIDTARGLYGYEDTPSYIAIKRILDERNLSLDAGDLRVGSKEWQDFYNKQEKPVIEKPNVTFEEGRKNLVLDKKIRYKNEVMTRRDYLDALKNDGYTPKERIINGKKTYSMENENGSGYKISKIEFDQIKSQSPSIPEVKPTIKIKPNDDLVKAFDEKIKVSQLDQPKPPELKQRGFSVSVQKSPNIIKQVKKEVMGGYESKPNDVLMGEAKALLTEGGTIDFKNTADLDKKVAAAMQEALNQQKAGNYEAAANLFNELSQQGTNLGRGVQAFSLLKNMSPESIALSAAGQIKKYNLANPTRKIPELNAEQTKLISDKVMAMDLLKGREKNIALQEINDIINSFIPSRLSDKVIATWKAGLLTSLRTHERNFLGNTIHGAMETIKDIPASGADILLSSKTGKRTITPTIKGISEFASKDTGQQMADIVMKGYDPSEQINKFDYKKINWGNNPLERALKKYTDTVFNTLGASDKPFYNAAMSRSLYSQAAAEAINQGKRGNKVFIENLVKNPTDDMFKIAIGDANVATFKDKNKASAVVSQLKQAMGKTELGKIVSEITMPFTGVPTSILGQILNYSPVGLLKGIANSGKVLSGQVPELQRQAAQEIGRGVMGTAIFSLGSYLAGKGLITGQPKDQTEARQWELENKPRNSIMIGGKWRSLNSIGPEAVVFLAGAKMNEELSSPEGNLGTYGVKLGKDYLDQSFVTGLQGPVNALTDPQRYAKSYIGNQISSFVPNIVKDISKATDTKARESNTVLDYAKQGIPGLRQTLPERRDVLGNVIKQEPTGIGAMVDVFNSKTPNKSIVVNELSRLNDAGENATPSKLSSSQTIQGQKVKLTPQELNTLEERIGGEVTLQLENLINSPDYQALDDESKSKAIDSVVASTRKIVKNTGQTSADKIKISDAGTKTDSFSNTKKQYTIINPETGSVTNIDLSEDIKFPELTGNTELDKKLKSKYYSSITTRINNVVKLYENNQLTAKEAEDLINDLKTSQSKSGSGKKSTKSKGGKITIKQVNYSTPKSTIKISMASPSKITFKKAPSGKIKISNNRKFTIKA